jgi:hypothetical protein
VELTALAFGDPGDYGDGLEITVTDVHRCPREAFRDDGKEHVRFTVIIRNGTGRRIELGKVGVTVRSGPYGRSASPTSGMASSASPGRSLLSTPPTSPPPSPT